MMRLKKIGSKNVWDTKLYPEKIKTYFICFEMNEMWEVTKKIPSYHAYCSIDSTKNEDGFKHSTHLIIKCSEETADHMMNVLEMWYSYFGEKSRLKDTLKTEREKERFHNLLKMLG